MQELTQQVLDLLRGMWHRRWIGLAVAWIVAIVAVAVVSRIPEKYEASARVYVDTESLLRPLLAGLAIQPNLDQQVALISRTLISRPNVEKLVRMADLDLGVQTNEQREELVDQVTRSIQLGGNVAANLYVISYRDSDPNRPRRSSSRCCRSSWSRASATSGRTRRRRSSFWTIRSRATRRP